METIDDIVKEILKEVRESERNNPDKTTRIFLTSSNMALKDFARRAKKAYKSMVEGLNGGIVERDQYIEKLTNENARLRAELNKDDCLKLANDVDRLRAENARLKAALVASNDELNLARSNSRSMYKRLNDENLRITEMDRETIHGLRDENERLKAALQPVLDIVMDKHTSDLSMELAIKEAQSIWSEVNKS